MNITLVQAYAWKDNTINYWKSRALYFLSLTICNSANPHAGAHHAQSNWDELQAWLADGDR